MEKGNGVPSEDRSGGESVVRVGVVLPVHNEERHVLAALRSVERSMRHVAGRSVECRMAVVLDGCADRSADVVGCWLAGGSMAGRVQVVTLRARNVGLARQTGCAVLLERWSTAPAEHIWLATTDADSEVPPDWLVAQLEARDAGSHVWVGTVEVESWEGRADGTADEWSRQYALEHRPVHGANFGVDAATYLRAGGFEPRVTGEDRDLLERLLLHGAVARVDASVRVVTSGRRHARAPRGFAHALSAIEASLPDTAVAS